MFVCGVEFPQSSLLDHTSAEVLLSVVYRPQMFHGVQAVFILGHHLPFSLCCHLHQCCQSKAGVKPLVPNCASALAVILQPYTAVKKKKKSHFKNVLDETVKMISYNKP